MTLLSLAQKACPVIGIPRPVAVVGSTSPQLATLLELANIGGEELAEAHRWQMLLVRRTFTGIAANAQTGEPPVDFNRWPATQKIWDNARKTWLIGPIPPNEWDGIMVRATMAHPGYWCILRGVINIAPAPTVSDTFTYSYITENWIRPPGGAADGSGDTAEYGDDLDVPLLDESLLKLDLIWRWKQAKGLDYAEDMSTFERKKEKAIARDPGPREITTTDPYSEGPPEGFWPGTITEA